MKKYRKEQSMVLPSFNSTQNGQNWWDWHLPSGLLSTETVVFWLDLAEQEASRSNRFLLSRSVRRQRVRREESTGCFIKVDKDWEGKRPGAFRHCSGGHTHLVINEGLYKTGRPRMTDTLLAWMSWKGRRILGRNEGEREHYNFLEHKGARQLGDQRHWLSEDLACDWCGLTDPAFFLGKDPSYWNWDQGETACGGWRLGCI